MEPTTIATQDTSDTVDVSTLTDAELGQRMTETSPSQEKTVDAKTPDVSVAKPEADKQTESVKKTTETVNSTVVEKTHEVKPPAVEQISVSKTEWEKLQKRTKEQESFIGRQSSEIGKLRQSAAEKMQSIEKEFADGAIDMISNPLEGAKKISEYNAAKADDYELGRQQYNLYVKEQVSAIIPDFEASLEGIADVLKADGYEAGTIRDFLAHPYDEKPILLINLARRAEADKRYKAAMSEVETLKKKPAEVARKIEAALNEPQTMTAKSGQTIRTNTEMSESQIPFLSDAELAERLKNNTI